MRLSHYIHVFPKVPRLVAYPRTQALGELLADTGQSSLEWVPPIDGDAYGQVDRVIREPLALGDAVVLGPQTVHESMPTPASGFASVAIYPQIAADRPDRHEGSYD